MYVCLEIAGSYSWGTRIIINPTTQLHDIQHLIEPKDAW